MKIELTPEELAELLKYDKPERLTVELNKSIEIICEHPCEGIAVKKFYVCLKCAKILEPEGCR